jgi:hypothetical protein
LVEESKTINSTLNQLKSSILDMKMQGQAINDKLGDSSRVCRMRSRYICAHLKVLKQVVNEQGKIGANLELSKHLLSSYSIRDLTDKLLLVIAVLFYLAVCVYIIFSRVQAPLSYVMSFIQWLVSFVITSDATNDLL